MKKVFLFPLTNSVMLKKVTLPYHVFEPRYREMVHDSIDTQTPIAVVNYTPTGEYRDQIVVVGIPKILSEYPDGRMDIYITGEEKVKIGEQHIFSRTTPYEVRYAQPIAEDMEVKDHFCTELTTLSNLVTKWATQYLPDPDQRANFRKQLEDPELMVNYCVTFLIDDQETKTKIVKVATLEEKVDMLINALSPKEVVISQFMPPLRFK